MTNNSDYSRDLHDAALEGDIKRVWQLLEQGADPNRKSATGYTPLQLAARNGRSESVEALLDAGAELDTRDSHGDTPLGMAMFATTGDPVATVALLLNAGADPDCENDAGKSARYLSKLMAHPQYKDLFTRY